MNKHSAGDAPAEAAVLLKPTLRMIVRNWWPVAAWLGVIRLESTSFASSRNTFHLLYRVLFFLFGRIDVRLVWELDHWLRKSGHFIGYAILSGLTYLALRNTHRDQLRAAAGFPSGERPGCRWRIEWSVIAVLLTVVAASLDEIHQASLPSRTGRWQDVLIDTSGALALQVVIYAISRLRPDSRPGNGHRPASTSSPSSKRSLLESD